MCSRPYRQGVVEFGCGQCRPCRINRARLWTGRIFLESQLHEENTFITLTYGPDKGNNPGELSPDDVRLWRGRLRHYLGHEFRYYIIGEYGPQTGRPHYHGILFGVSPTSSACDDAWGLGFVQCGSVTPESARYVAGYCTKGALADYENGVRKDGRYPEFSRMSRKPGLGARWVDAIAYHVGQNYGLQKLIEDGDVPSTIRFGGRTWSLGNYLRRKVRESSGITLPGGVRDVVAIYEPSPQERMLRLRSVDRYNEKGGREGLEQRRLNDVDRAEQKAKLRKGNLI